MGRRSVAAGVAVRSGVINAWDTLLKRASGALPWLEDNRPLRSALAESREPSALEIGAGQPAELTLGGAASKCAVSRSALTADGCWPLKMPVGIGQFRPGEGVSCMNEPRRWCSGSSWRSAWLPEPEEEVELVSESHPEADSSSGFIHVQDDMTEQAEADGTGGLVSVQDEMQMDGEAMSMTRLPRGPSGKYENLMEVVRLCKMEVVAAESREERMGLGGVLLEGPFEFVRIPGRSWSLVDPSEKLLAKAASMALSRVYEPHFSDYSHGFRPSKGCHSVMLQMKKKWRGINFFMKYDIKKCYEQINRQQLRSVLEEQMEDQRFVDLVLRLYQTEARVCHELKDPPPETGFPRGSILLKALCNVYLDKLDQEVLKLQKEYEYSRDMDDFHEDTHDEEDEASDDSESEADEGGYNYRKGDAEVRIRYLRYGDQFLVGFTGPKPLMKDIQHKIQDFVKTDLHLDAQLDHLVHVTSGHVRFLGMRVAGLPESKGMRRYAKGMEKRRRVKARLKQFAKQRQESWDIQMRNLILLAWARAFKKVRSTVASSVEAQHVLHKKAREIVTNYALEKLEAGESKQTVLELLEKEKVDMMKVSWLGIPEDILAAHENLTQVMQDFLDEEDRAEAELAAVTPRVSNKVRSQRRNKYRDTIPLQVLASMEEITDKLKKRGILTPRKSRPNSLGPKTNIPDEEIVAYFASVAYALITYYRCCDNLTNVRRLVDYQIRWSAIFTLACKHKSSARQVVVQYTRDLHVFKDGKMIARFPSSVELVRNMGKRFLPGIYEEMVDQFIR